MAKRTTKIGATVTIGKIKLIEKDLYLNGEYEDSICIVKRGRTQLGVYTSIPDAMHHKGEWSDD